MSFDEVGYVPEAPYTYTPPVETLSQRWAAALRSEQYRKCCGVLHHQDGAFCVVGVLADIQGVRWARYDDDSDYHFVDRFAGVCVAVIPNSLHPGISSDYIDQIMAVNDQTPITFEELADYIEKEELPPFDPPNKEDDGEL